MSSGILSVDADLLATSRVPTLASIDGDVRPIELVALALAGVAAALLTNVLRLNLGIPGSSIVFATFPIALGFALVPRRGAGAVMAGAATLTTMGLGFAGAGVDGPGALTSLILTGPLLDLALRFARGGGWRLYGAFVVAGALSNACAFAVRGGLKAFGIAGMGGGRPFASWWPTAIATYTIAGVAAGLISALAWFSYRDRRGPTRAT
ncbi:MAG TPA: hypothetical protein VFK39_05220 [Gemmatimonadaceae bacterium]|nr:hypothetical protein [Gemmatimonadaceae bacterium]